MSKTNKYLTIMNKRKNVTVLHLEHTAEEICFESLTAKDQKNCKNLA